MKILVNGDWRDVNSNLLAPALQELAAKLDRQSASGQPLPANVMC